MWRAESPEFSQSPGRIPYFPSREFMRAKQGSPAIEQGSWKTEAGKLVSWLFLVV